MGLSNLDYTIVLIFFATLTVVALYFSKKASGSLDEYFLGGRSIPWFILGISGMAAFIDISGTMQQTSFYYLWGVKGFWFRAVFNITLAYYMIYIGKYLNRSKVMTNAEWMTFRFGKGKQGSRAQLFTASAAMVMVLAFMAYFFIGACKFFPDYLPVSILDPATVDPARLLMIQRICGVIFFAVVMIFIVAAGFYGVVYTDLVQGLLIIGVIIFVGFKAMSIATPEFVAKFTSSDWVITQVWKGTGEYHDWMSTQVPWIMNTPPKYGEFSIFGLLAIAWTLSMVIGGFGQPMDAWMAQKFYAAKNEKQSGLISMQWIVMYGFRFALMMGIGILAISLADKITDPERAFNAVINTYMPNGVRGILLAAIIAAGISSLTGIVNSSAAYFVKDIYHKYINPKASNKNLVFTSYMATFTIMLIGILIGLTLENIKDIWGWILMGLFVGMWVPHILKWYWWRFNGNGFAWGMGSGILGALLYQLVVFLIQKNTNIGRVPEFWGMIFILPINIIGTLIGVYRSKPTEMDTLVEFYKRVKPMGWWGPVREKCEPEFVREVQIENRRDFLLILPAIIWQMSLYWEINVLVAKQWISLAIFSIPLVITSWILYKYWYKNLKAV